MQGLDCLLGRVGDIKFIKSPFVPDDTFIVSERTWDRIVAAFPEARQDIKESQATDNQQTQLAICPKCDNRGILGMNIGDDGHTEYCDCIAGKQQAGA